MDTQDTQEKMFYTPSEASEYLNIKQDVLLKWLNRLQIETRSLPHMKGRFIAKRDVELIQQNMKNPLVLL